MNKKIMILGIALVIAMAASFLTYKFIYKGKEEKQVNPDAVKFKEEYESLNNTDNGKDKNYRAVEINDENVFVYVTAEELAEKIDNDETFIVYFGFKSCPWCRSVISTLDKVSREKKVDKIYYVDVLDIRDTLTLSKKDKVTTSKEGSEGYQKLIEQLSNVLADYTLTNSKDKKVKTGEKRIYAPNIVTVVKGEAVKLVEGISPDQTDAYMELTDDMLDYTTKQFEEVIQLYLDADCENQKFC